MAPKAVELSSFGGLDVRNDPQQTSLSAAVDMRNVTLDAQGRLRTRDGQASVASLAATAAGIFTWKLSSQVNDRLVIPTSTNVYVYTTDGTNNGSTASASTYSDFAAMGVSGTVGYLARGASTIQKVSLFGVLTSPAGMPNASFLAVQAPDNRLVAGDTSTGGARVSFSDAGAPETWGANNWVDLDPYDGDQLTALVAWGNLIFAFKYNKFYVFFGNGTDGAGQPEFNFRKVSSTLGALSGLNSLKCAVAGPDGVYFMHRSGVYRTTGSTPTKISQQIEPLFRNTALNPYYTGVSGSSFTPGGLHIVGNKLVLRGSSSDWLVYDLEVNNWSYWTMPGALANYATTAVGPDTGATVERLYLATTSLLRLTPNATDDAGASFTGAYRTGFWNPGAPGAESWIREVLLDGSGTVTVKQSVNDTITLGSGQSVTLGTAPVVTQGRDRRGLRGRNFSYEFSGTAPWALSRVQPIVWGQRVAGEKAA